MKIFLILISLLLLGVVVQLHNIHKSIIEIWAVIKADSKINHAISGLNMSNLGIIKIATIMKLTPEEAAEATKFIEEEIKLQKDSIKSMDSRKE